MRVRLLQALAMSALVACAATPSANLDAPTRAPARRVADERPLPATCPQDAPWTGQICMGQGYVTCPGGSGLVDNACVGAVPDGGTVARRDPPPKRRAHVEEPPMEDPDEP